MAKDLDYYLNLPWTYSFMWSNEDKCYIASVAELKGCISDGRTIKEATDMIEDAVACYIETMLELNKPIPEPIKPSDFKGNITYRTSSEKHYRLVQKAAVTGKSVNALIDEAVEEKLKYGT